MNFLSNLFQPKFYLVAYSIGQFGVIRKQLFYTDFADLKTPNFFWSKGNMHRDCFGSKEEAKAVFDEFIERERMQNCSYTIIE